MVHFEILEGDDVGEIKIIAEAVLEHSPTAGSMNEIVRVISDCINNSISYRLAVELEELLLNEMKLRLKLAFLQPNVTDEPLPVADLGRLRTNFVFYVFAMVNSRFPLKEVAFPEGYTYFISLPQTLESEYGWK